MREKVFNIRFSEEEWARIQALAAHHELPAAQILRLLIKREHAAIFPAPAKKSKR